MVILQFEHTVSDFDTWKRIFDSDPLGRQQSGVRRVWVMRPVGDDRNHVVAELEFDTAGEAETFRGRLEDLWRKNEGTIMRPIARIVEVVETLVY